MTGVGFTLLPCLVVLLLPKSSDSCGTISTDIPTVGRRITDGEKASVGEFPWQVGLRSFGSTFCSGVLIDRQWVLTSARCFNGHYDPSSWIVVLGDYDRQRHEGTELQAHVHNVVIHGGFTKDPYTNDLAMVQLVNANHDIPSLCLPDPSTDLVGSDCFISGWGATARGEDLTNTLRKLPMKVVPRSQCPLPSNKINPSDYLCATSSSQNGGPCTGDTGASLQCRQGKTWVAAGIVYDTYGCDVKSSATGLYTNVKSYLPWIEKTIKLLASD